MPPFIASCTIVLLLDLVLPALLLFSSIHSLQDPHWPQSPQAQSIGLAAGAGVVPAVNQLEIMNMIYKSKMSLNLAQSSDDSTDNCLPLVLSMAPWIFLPFGNGSPGVFQTKRPIIMITLTFVSMGTFLLPSSTSLTVKLVVALLVEDAVIIGLLEGKPLAVLNLVALFNAFLEGGNGK